MRWLFTAVCLILFPGLVGASSLPLQNLDGQDFRDVIKDLSANSLHTSVSGASSLGTIFGFEIGLVGGVTRTSRLNSLAQEVDSSADAKTLPHAELLGVLTVPLGLTAEVGYMPKVGSDDFKYGMYAAAVKWTPTDLLLDWPLSVAVKGHISRARADFKATIVNTPTQFEYKNTVTGLMVLASKNFALFEPYVGFGWIRGRGELLTSGSTTVFDSSYTLASGAQETVVSAHYLAGIELKLLTFKLGAEYARAFDTTRMTGKLSLSF